MSAAAILRESLTALRPSDWKLFEDVTGLALDSLLSAIWTLPEEQLDVIALSTGMDLMLHPLNARGLQVLRYLTARRVSDRNRERKGWTSHPDYQLFMRDGFLVKKLSNFDARRPLEAFQLSAEEMDVVALVTGYTEPFTASSDLNEIYHAKPRSNVRTIGNQSVWIRPQPRHVFFDKDNQYQLHIDMIQPIFKIFFFVQNVTLKNGPLHLVPRSHHASHGKLSWLWDRTRHNVDPRDRYEAELGGAHRHINLSALSRALARRPSSFGKGINESLLTKFSESALPKSARWCTSPRSCLEEAYEFQQHDLRATYGFPSPLPLTVKAGSMIVADTSAFHFRGYETKYTVRAQMSSPALGPSRDAPGLAICSRQIGLCAAGSPQC